MKKLRLLNLQCAFRRMPVFCLEGTVHTTGLAGGFDLLAVYAKKPTDYVGFIEQIVNTIYASINKREL